MFSVPPKPIATAVTRLRVPCCLQQQSILERRQLTPPWSVSEPGSEQWNLNTFSWQFFLSCATTNSRNCLSTATYQCYPQPRCPHPAVGPFFQCKPRTPIPHPKTRLPGKAAFSETNNNVHACNEQISTQSTSGNHSKILTCTQGPCCPHVPSIKG